MYLTVVVVAGMLIIGLIVIRSWLNSLSEKTRLSNELVEWLKSSTTNIDQRLSQSMEMFNTRLDNAAKVIGQVQKNIGELTAIGGSMKELQEFLSSPKIRGNIGEQILKDLLKQYFPKDTYKLQYSFKSGEKVDAIIITSQGFIPIDSKFPLDNFKKYSKAIDEKDKKQYKKMFVSDVKKHITDIAKKYILPEENTVDYALMYIPSENVYYEIISDDEIFDYAGKKMVLPVSPMSFYAYLKAILLSFEGQKIETKAKQIINLLTAIKKDYLKTEETLLVLNRHINNAYNQSNQVVKNFQNLGQKINSTRLLSSEKEKLLE